MFLNRWGIRELQRSTNSSTITWIPVFRVWTWDSIPDNHQINSEKLFKHPPFPRAAAWTLKDSIHNSNNIVTLECGRKKWRSRGVREDSMRAETNTVLAGRSPELWTPSLPSFCDLSRVSLPLQSPGLPHLRNGMMISYLPGGMVWTRWLPKVSATRRPVIYQKFQSFGRHTTQLKWTFLLTVPVILPFSPE